jgi:hypothetical protein
VIFRLFFATIATVIVWLINHCISNDLGTGGEIIFALEISES